MSLFDIILDAFSTLDFDPFLLDIEISPFIIDHVFVSFDSLEAGTIPARGTCQQEPGSKQLAH